MTSTPGHSAYAGYGFPADDQRWRRQSGPRKEGVKRLSRSLWTVVAVLGASTLAVSFCSPALLEFPLLSSSSAAIVAAVGLLRGQSERGWIVVALAVSGFLDALSMWVRTDQSSWALTVIMVLNALQSLTAVGALLCEAGAVTPVEAERISDQTAYAQLAAAYNAYAARFQQPPAQHNAAGQAAAQGEARAPARASNARVDDSQQSLAALQARYFQQGGFTPPQRPRGSTMVPPVVPTADPGIPDASSGAQRSQRYRSGQQNSGEGRDEVSGR